MSDDRRDFFKKVAGRAPWSARSKRGSIPRPGPRSRSGADTRRPRRPGSDLFVVFNEDLGDGATLRRVANRGFAVKLTYLAPF